MKNKMLNLINIAAVSLFSLVMGTTVYCSESGSSLPDVASETGYVWETEDHKELPDLNSFSESTSLEKTKEVIPNPGSFLLGGGQLITNDYSFEGSLYDVYAYEMTGDWKEAVTEYLKECGNKGFVWDVTELDSETAYIISCDDGKAIFVPDHDNAILFMKEPSLEMEELVMIKEDTSAPLEKGELRINYNGGSCVISRSEAKRKRSYASGKTSYDINAIMTDDHDNMCYLFIHLSGNISTGDDISIDINTTSDLLYTLKIGYYSFSKYGIYDPKDWTDSVIYAGKIRNGKKDDYLNMKILYLDEESIRFSFDGVFEGEGKVISGEGFLDIRK